MIDGAMGTVIQRDRPAEAGYRGERFADWPSDLQGNNDLLTLTQPRSSAGSTASTSRPAPTSSRPTPRLPRVIEIEELGLVDPLVIAAFEGWNDAADAASAVVDHLIEVWDARVVGAIDPEDFYDFQVNRPLVGTDEDGHRRVTWPTTQFAVASPPDLDRDVILVRGIEPNMRWRQFCAELLAACDDLGGELVVTLGALLADTPHTRPIPVTGTATEPDLVDRLKLEQSTYEGPTGIVGVFQDACVRLDIPAVSYWAAVPHYVAQPPCPKATLALLGQIEDLLDCSIPLGDLPEEARAWERGVDELAEEDEDVADYVRSLEETRDTTDLPEARARRSPGSSSATSSGATTRAEPGRQTAATGRPQRARPSAASSAGRATVARRPRVAGVGEPVGAEGGADPGVHRGHRASVRRGRRRAPPSTASTTGAAGAPAPSARARRHRRAVSTASQSWSSVHSQSER